MTLKNEVQLIVYPDSLGGDLVELHYVLRRYLSRAIGGVHLLPFYPSSADRGFAPLTYDKVDPAFGTWRDIDLIGREFDLVIDFMVNHISRLSVYFQDYFEKGPDSEFADMFLSFNKLSPTGEISEADLAKVYTRKPRPPYTIIQRADGSKEKVWCTFDYEQIDLDWDSPKTREVMRRYLIQLSRTPAKMIRMDAFAYSTLKLGTNCFFLEPQVWQLLQWLQDYISPFDVEILPEVHEHYSYHQKISAHGYWTYDFSLPMLVLHTLYHHTSRALKQWLAICPHKQITTLPRSCIKIKEKWKPKSWDTRYRFVFTLCSMMAHNLSRELQMLAAPAALRALPKRPAAWKLERLDTLRHRILQRAGHFIRPQGELTLSMSANAAVRCDLMHFLDSLQKAA